MELTDARKSELQVQYRLETKRDMAEVIHKVEWLETQFTEKLHWLERVDETIDNIARGLNVAIPYGVKGPDDDARYNPAYRLELLRKEIRRI